MADIEEPTLLDAALAYAARGWPVFPCSTATKRPLLARDKDANGKPIKGTGGVSKASTDPDQIRAWWTKWPRAAIGVATGRNGLFVLDFDPCTDEKTGKVHTLESLKADLEAMMGVTLPLTLAVRTAGRAGVHSYLEQPDDGGAPITNRGNLPDHIDVRGLGGYVIVPPSLMDNGARYRWLHGNADVEPVAAPPELIAILRAPARAEQKDVAAPAAASRPSSSFLPPSARPAGERRALDPSDAEDEAVRRYALGALDNEVSRARELGKGFRNKGISAAAIKLGHFVGAGVLSRALCLASLTEVGRMWPDLEKTVASIESGLDTGIADPIDLTRVRTEARERAERNRAWEDRQRSRAPSSFGPRAGDNEYRSFRSGTIGDDIADGGEGDGEPPETPREKARREALERIRLHQQLARYNRTDLGNAERFRDRFGQDFRFSPALGWLKWDDRRWKMLAVEDKGIPGDVLAAVYKMVRLIRREAWILKKSGLHDPETNPAGLDRVGYDEKGRATLVSSLLFAWAEKSESAGKLRCVAGLVQPWITVEADAFDTDPYTVNVLNGTLRFKRVKSASGAPPHKVAWELVPHRREHLITKIAPITFRRDATCPNYDRVMAWAQPDQPTRRYLHQWGGLNLTGEMGEQILHFWHGGGGNAKSTIIDAWAHAAGDYSTTVGIETFLDQGVKKAGGNATPDLARLGGVRFLRTSEPEKGAQLAEALIKLVTGGEPMAVRFLNKGFFDLRPLYKLTISGNHWLGISGTDNGIWRRVKLIPWASQITDAEKDETLPEKLRAEADGIFNRMMEGLLDYLRHELIEPEAVKRATAEYRDASDPLGRFLKLCVKPSTGGRVQSSHLHKVFVAWCEAAGEKPWSNKGLAKALIDKGYRKKASDGMQWLDIELVFEVHDFVDADGNAKPFTLAEDPDPPPRPSADGGASGDDDDDIPY